MTGTTRKGAPKGGSTYDGADSGIMICRWAGEHFTFAPTAFFFFSSRRRHTRCGRDWSSDVCSSDLGLLHSIRGGLSLVPLERASAMLTSAEQYVTEVLLHGKRVPDWRELDTLADAVTSIEYYLERLADGITDNDSILRLAEDSFAQLGFPVGQEPTWQKAEADPAGDEPPVLEPEIPVVEPIAPVQKTSDHELLDDEILGIFVEEAEEVLQAIQDQYPRLRQNYEDRAALTEVRRAFHTLKGSGRMVGAISIGELAWSIENLLNRVIDQTQIGRASCRERV